jgi:K+-transporting ATPase A subunit
MLLVATIVIVGMLTFMPVLAMGALVEHYLMTASGVTF